MYKHLNFGHQNFGDLVYILHNFTAVPPDDNIDVQILRAFDLDPTFGPAIGEHDK